VARRAKDASNNVVFESLTDPLRSVNGSVNHIAAGFVQILEPLTDPLKSGNGSVNHIAAGFVQILEPLTDPLRSVKIR
jgi:hypothetical protein